MSPSTPWVADDLVYRPIVRQAKLGRNEIETLDDTYWRGIEPDALRPLRGSWRGVEKGESISAGQLRPDSFPTRDGNRQHAG